MSMGFIHNFDQFVSLRALLGLAEGGLFPGMVGSASLLDSLLAPLSTAYFPCTCSGSISFHHLHTSRTCSENRCSIHCHVSLWSLWRYEIWSFPALFDSNYEQDFLLGLLPKLEIAGGSLLGAGFLLLRVCL
jgi:hypothetical protein